MFSKMDQQVIREIITFDAGLAAMQLMLVARAKGLETNPMSGFDKARFAIEFELEDRYVPMVLIPIGKAAKEGHATTRLPIDKVTFWGK